MLRKYVWTAVKVFGKATLCALSFMAIGAALIIGATILSGCA